MDGWMTDGWMMDKQMDGGCTDGWMDYWGPCSVLEHSDRDAHFWRMTPLLYSHNFIHQDLLRPLLSRCLVTWNVSSDIFSCSHSLAKSASLFSRLLSVAIWFCLSFTGHLPILPPAETGLLCPCVQMNLTLLSQRVSLVSLAGFLSPLSEWDLGAAKRETNLFLIWRLPLLQFSCLFH